MKTIFVFELKQWIKSKTVWITFIIWCVFVSFAIQGRLHSIRVLVKANDTSTVYETNKAAAYYVLLDSAETGKKVFDKYATDPRNPVFYNNSLPRFAIYKAGPLNALATGQSDVQINLYVITRRYDIRNQKEEAVNGLQLLYGKLDVAFLLVFLLPMIIIALNYNLLSSEKEKGTLPLLLAQSGSLQKIVWAKLFVSILFSLLFTSVPLIVLLLTGTSLPGVGSPIAIYFLATFLYSLFWHLLCAFINSSIKSSAYNATVLLSAWLFIVLVLPALVNTVTEIIHPVPSRTKFITEYRHTLNEMERDSASRILDKYFYDHPELVKEDTSGNMRNRANAFYKAMHINQDKTQTVLQPLYASHDNALQSANDFAAKAGLISPAVCMNQTLLLLAGQSNQQYLFFKQQVHEWRKPYLAFILKKLLQDKNLTKKETEVFKPFGQPRYDYTKQIFADVLMLLLMNLLLIGFIKASLNKKSIA